MLIPLNVSQIHPDISKLHPYLFRYISRHHPNRSRYNLDIIQTHAGTIQIHSNIAHTIQLLFRHIQLMADSTSVRANFMMFKYGLYHVSQYFQVRTVLTYCYIGILRQSIHNFFIFHKSPLLLVLEF